MFAIGAARRDITPADALGVGMLGWARWDQVVTGVAAPLHARAFVVADPEGGRRLAIVVAEIAFATQALKDAVMARLPGWDERDVLLTATHTHSAPGGISHHLTYNLFVPGVHDGVLAAYADGIAGAVRDAADRLAPGRLRLGVGAFAPEVEVAFNRSLAAHNANRDRERTFAPDEAHLAVDREMAVLRAEDEAGNPLGLLDWFAVHPINVHSDNGLITPDNKGHAAASVEARFGGRFVAAFAQGAAADVSPNFKRYPDEPRGPMRGKFRDDFESMRFNGDAQAALALDLFAAAREAPALAGELDAAFAYVDLVDMPVPPRFADGYVGVTTGAAAIGARMLGGTSDGGGVTSLEVDAFRALAALAKARAQVEAFVAGADRYRALAARQRAQGAKDVVIEPTEGRLLGVRALDRLPLPEGRDPAVPYLKRLAAAGVAARPWTPHVLPFQILVLGSLAIVALPAELTTQAGRRLRASVQEVLAERGVTRVQLTGYANAYSGYVTTPEEYDRQGYEGASTHFGRWTLGAYQAACDGLARELLQAPSERPRRGLRPPALDPSWLPAMSHAQGQAWWREAGFR